MEGPTPQLTPQDVAAAFGWWRDAGVDLDFSDEVLPWLTADKDDDAPAPLPAAFTAPRAQIEAQAPSEQKIGGDRAAWPTALEHFADWWLTEPSLDAGQVRGRVPPRGPARAPLMVLVAQPEPTDGESLLSGPEGVFLTAMLAAMGHAPEQVYLAAALPRHTPLPDWDRLGAQGLGGVLCHHVRLAAPQRLLVLGSGILPLLGHDPAQNAQISPLFNHEGWTIPMMPAFELPAIAARPARKAGFWNRWLEFSGSGLNGDL
ncbi:hypothetical protein H7F51_12125 [Novosphingobium flavum]|uniref:DNA polymerase n=1 Tax=Novosphingobium flavum TaxID=1778672 RepID=A0A7X1KM49_9SPHN|nr:hypothetical protein [Novosphingobium flavum]MBC2666266.1 hypothetical protein [Novosphingobium flavum]